MKRYGILDIGTNTVHAAVYQVEGTAFEKEDSYAVWSPVPSNIQNGALSIEGIFALHKAIQELLAWFAKKGTDSVHIFATASLRMVSNAQEVCAKIRELAGVDFCVLTGNEEAECDFLAMQSTVHTTRGVGFDLGGGSMQVVEFANNNLIAAVSLPTGANRYWRQFVAGRRPTRAELEAIYRAATAQLQKLPKMPCSRLYAMGGTAKRARKMLEILTGKPLKILRVPELQALAGMPDFLEKAAGERYQTLTAGVVIITALCSHFKATDVQVLSCGVRDGYLQKLLDGKVQSGF